MIPIIRKILTFERVKAPNFHDRKWHCIGLILCHLRSWKLGSFHAAEMQGYF
jgi:hypothetical protein